MFLEGLRVEACPLTGLPDESADSTEVPSMIAVGAVDYDRASSGEALSDTLTSAPIDASSFSRAFAPLPGTAREVDAICDLFQEHFSEAPIALRDDRASRNRLREAVIGKRNVHLATHG